MSEPTIEQRVEALEQVITGQTAQIAMLTGLLFQSGALDAESAALVPMAGIIVRDNPNAPSPEKVSQWVRDQISSGKIGKKGRKKR